MPSTKKVFGSPRYHTGKLQSAEATHVPVNYLAQIKPRNPVVISGDTIAVTISGGANAPLLFWNGSDYYELRTTKAFTWSTSNTLLDATSGAVLTAQTAISTGVWYFYLGITGSTDTAFAFALYPSKIPPTPVGAGEYNKGWYVHPGTAKETYWDYVGWCAITTAGDADTAPVMKAFNKKGYWYTFAETTSSQTGQSSAAATADFSATIPVHQVEVAGYLTCPGASTYMIVSDVTLTDSTAAGIIEVAHDDTGAITAPFSSLVPDTAGYLYSIQGNSAASIIGITRVKDVV